MKTFQQFSEATEPRPVDMHRFKKLVDEANKILKLAKHYKDGIEYDTSHNRGTLTGRFANLNRDQYLQQMQRVNAYQIAVAVKQRYILIDLTTGSNRWGRFTVEKDTGTVRPIAKYGVPNSRYLTGMIHDMTPYELALNVWDHLRDDVALTLAAKHLGYHLPPGVVADGPHIRKALQFSDPKDFGL